MIDVPMAATVMIPCPPIRVAASRANAARGPGGRAPGWLAALRPFGTGKLSGHKVSIAKSGVGDRSRPQPAGRCVKRLQPEVQPEHQQTESQAPGDAPSGWCTFAPHINTRSAERQCLRRAIVSGREAASPTAKAGGHPCLPEGTHSSRTYGVLAPFAQVVENKA